MFAKAAAMPPLHRDGMAARREYLGDARRLQPTGGHPHARALPTLMESGGIPESGAF